MKTLRFIMIAGTTVFLLSSCSVWNSVFKPKTGCPGNGKNIGAEKLLGGDEKAEKEARKAKNSSPDLYLECSHLFSSSVLL